MTDEALTQKELAEAFRALITEVERYIEKPGCNIQSRKTAMQRLKWAAERARQRSVR